MFEDSGIYYQNNKNLVNLNYNHPFTRDEIAEMAKCAMDPIYFINNYVKIVNLDEGLILFKTRPFQDRMVESFHQNRNTIAKVGRQAGKCSCINTIVIIKNKEYNGGKEFKCTIGQFYEWQLLRKNLQTLQQQILTEQVEKA